MNQISTNRQFIQACITRQNAKRRTATFKQKAKSFLINASCIFLIAGAVLPTAYIFFKSCADDVDHQETAAWNHQDQLNTNN